ncbi:hypothetical protein GOV14_03455 [Candidatus Pacearchaeota archaeon]|nr:hypothetical protein [Candidatus Pacearchaeota archaeon]
MEKQIILEGIITSAPEILDNEIRIPFRYTNIKSTGFEENFLLHLPSTANRLRKIRLKMPKRIRIPIRKNTRIKAYYQTDWEDEKSIPDSSLQFLYADSIGIVDEETNKEFATYHSTW